MSRLTRDGTAEPVSRDQIFRHLRGLGNVHFPCSADHEQDWQPYPVDPYRYSAICDDHIASPSFYFLVKIIYQIQREQCLVVLSKITSTRYNAADIILIVHQKKRSLLLRPPIVTCPTSYFICIDSCYSYFFTFLDACGRSDDCLLLATATFRPPWLSRPNTCGLDDQVIAIGLTVETLTQGQRGWGGAAAAYPLRTILGRQI